MGKYQEQAKKYENDSVKIIEELQSTITSMEEVNNLLSENKDAISYNIKNNYNNQLPRIDEIGRKRNSISTSLSQKAKEIDDRIAAELRRKKEKEDEEKEKE